MKIPTLAEKGKYATLIGIILAISVTIFVVIDYIRGTLPVEAVVFYALYGISAGFMILPSKVKVMIGKFEAEMED